NAGSIFIVTTSVGFAPYYFAGFGDLEQPIITIVATSAGNIAISASGGSKNEVISICGFHYRYCLIYSASAISFYKFYSAENFLFLFFLNRIVIFSTG